MPVAKLFVEGNLDSEILASIFQGTPVLQQGGSKNSLRPRTWTERRENHVAAGYLRDRDFDHDPPGNLTKPTVDADDRGVPIGWRWCRHEIENYLIEPAVVGEATGWAVSAIEDAIRGAAAAIRGYEAARWTVGVVRRELPPQYELKTRPEGLSEIDLPQPLDLGTVSRWTSESIESHRLRIAGAADSASVQDSFGYFISRFDDSFIQDVQAVLPWFPGKDLLAGMADWLRSRGLANPGEFRALLRDWIRSNSERALELLPEWRGLVEALRA